MKSRKGKSEDEVAFACVLSVLSVLSALSDDTNLLCLLCVETELGYICFGVFVVILESRE